MSVVYLGIRRVWLEFKSIDNIYYDHTLKEKSRTNTNKGQKNNEYCDKLVDETSIKYRDF